MNKYNRFSERFWFVMASLATIGSIIIAFIDGIKFALFYFLLSGIAWGLYLVKMGIRKRLEILDETNRGKNPKKK